MATFGNPTLSFTDTTNPSTVLVKATVDITFTTAELHMLANGLIFIIKCGLFEQDVGGTDEPLFVFGKKRVTTSTTVVFQQQLDKSVFDDEGGPDEIQARFSARVGAMIPAPINSPRVIVDY